MRNLPAYPRGVYFFILFLFSGGAFFSFPPPFFCAGRAFFPGQPLFPACRPARFGCATREPRIPPGGIFIGRRGHFHAIITAFSRISAIFREFPRHAKSPGGESRGDHGAGSLFLRCAGRVTGGEHKTLFFAKNIGLINGTDEHSRSGWEDYPS